jgi:hypothetical protein
MRDQLGANDGLTVVLSPLQLAAILENGSLEQSSSLSNRIWGAATLVGGAVELIGAAGLLLVPEPTTVTKIAGGALAVHGADTASTGIVQIVTGRTRTTMTSQAAAAAAEALGASPDQARTVGMAVDIAVPLAAGFVGAARAIAIRRGAVSLVEEEAAGGHAIARHVGKTEAELRARLAAPKAPKAATTFRTLSEAERVVGDAIRANRRAIKEWAKLANAGDSEAFTYSAGRIIGFGVVKSTGKVHQATKMVFVLRKVASGNRIYFLLTAYPSIP